MHRVSRPNDLNEATRRISHNARYFGGNYSMVGRSSRDHTDCAIQYTVALCGKNRGVALG